ncbi:MAG: hypothetical protein ABIG71_03330 [Candidatus Uhrbacteria bacterium]
MEVYLQGKRIRVSPKQAIGKGGEADVYDIGKGLALKIFKQPNHPDYQGQPIEQQGAKERINAHQKKLPAFPKGLPKHVIVPEVLAHNQKQRVIGYAMPLVSGAELLRRYGERSFRSGGVPNSAVVDIFRDLHGTVHGTHAANVVIGDFNDLNVLVRGTDAWLIDADSFQFGPFPCRMFTARFVDPLLCDPKQPHLMLAHPHNADSDWYAYAVMLMQSLLFVDPYGGVYRPKEKRQRCTHDERPLKRITVFHPEVKYPKPAVPYGVLPDDLLQYFHLMFEKDKRGEFPALLLENLRWTSCGQCGTEHARSVCPNCAAAAPVATKQKVVIRGNVTAAQIFQTRGVILHACVQQGKLHFLYHEGRSYRRDGDLVILQGDRDPKLRFRIRGDRTLIARDDTLVTIREGEQPEQQLVERYRGALPMFDANSAHTYWLEHGVLQRDHTIGGINAPERIGDALANQTLFWVGEAFGFGLYRAGDLSVAFVFDAERHGINDGVRLPPIRGQLVDAACSFSEHRCWFFTAQQVSGKTIHTCTVIKSDGTIEAYAETDANDDTWLATIRGHAAVGSFLLVATDDGLVRVELSGTTLAVTKEFPDTEPFVDASCSLHASKEGLYVVCRNVIRRLTIR